MTWLTFAVAAYAAVIGTIAWWRSEETRDRDADMDWSK